MGCGTKYMCACFLLLNSSGCFCTVISCGKNLICVKHTTPLKFMWYFLCYPKSSIFRNLRELAHVTLIVITPTNMDSWDEDHLLPPWVEISKLPIRSWSSMCPKQVGEKDRRREFIEMTELLPKRLAACTYPGWWPNVLEWVYDSKNFGRFSNTCTWPVSQFLSAYHFILADLLL